MKKKVVILSLILIFLIFIISSIFLVLNNFKLKGKEVVNISIGEKYNDAGFKSKILFLSYKTFVKTTGSVNNNKVGEYEITYKLAFKTLRRKIIVEDKEEPLITLKGEKEINLSFGNTYNEEGYTAQDNVDGDITNKVVVEERIDYTKLGTYEITYEVTDSSNNKATTKRIINIIDDVAPVITLKGSSTVYVDLGGVYTESGYTASDNYDGDITNNVKVNSKVNTNVAGTYEIIYEVTDSSGNTTKVKRKIVVQIKITYVNGILLVNKNHPLPSTYAPGENKTAKTALLNLQNAASVAGYNIPLLSGYRSYSYQATLYNSYVKKDGEALASTYSAKPGYSEHQTGLAFDVGQISNSYGDTAAGKWLAANAHTYGFIIRYPKGKESITGYTYEPWHIRYVGISIATYIYNRNITLEEYLGVK